MTKFGTHFGPALDLSWKAQTTLEAMLEPSGSQKASKLEPKRVPHRAPEATRTDNGETLIFDESTQDFNYFSGLEAPFWN